MSQATFQQRAAKPVFDIRQFDFNELARQAFQPWSDAFETWRASVSDLANPAQARDRQRHDYTHHEDCGCSHCASDRCSCRCCVTDADLVVETRVGERRLVTLIVENHWRREREIELELSSWTKNLHGVEVQADILGPTAFKLAPCGEAQVVLGVTITPPTDEAKPDVAVNNPDRATGPGREIPDVTKCAVSYADLRIKGCDLRSIRIAVAVLPRDCDAYVVDCACGCC